MIKKLEYFHVQHTLFVMSDKRKYTKNPYAGKKRKAWNKPTNRFQINGRGSLLNLTKIHIATKGNGSMNMNMEKGGITMNIKMMNLV